MIGKLQEGGYECIPFSESWELPKHQKAVKIRLYISTVIHCPYEGHQSVDKLMNILEWVDKAGLNDFISQVCLGDTIGEGTPKKWKDIFSQIKASEYAMHCHDTYGTALASIYEGLSQGVSVFDSSLGGLGGCPYAKGAAGNLATEDLIHFLENEGLSSNVKLDKLFEVFDLLKDEYINNLSHVYQACNI